MLSHVQGLKFESYHNSPLAKLLLEQSCKSPRFAHQFFWLLKGNTFNVERVILLKATFETYFVIIIDEKPTNEKFLKAIGNNISEIYINFNISSIIFFFLLISKNLKCYGLSLNISATFGEIINYHLGIFFSV